MVKRMCLSAKERVEIKGILKEKTGYMIINPGLLNQIFRRSSFAAETGESSNEILEFIGDEILSFYVVKGVAERCGSFSTADDYTFRIRENRFTQIKQELVNNEALAKIIDEWDVAKYLLVSESDIKNNAVNEVKVKADLFEAIIGAVAVECNWDSEVLKEVVNKSLDFDTKIAVMIKDDTRARLFDIDTAVTALKEMAEKGECKLWEYQCNGPEVLGYDKDGNPKWACLCRAVNDRTGVSILVWSNSKKGAKKAAAYLALCELLGVQNKYGPNDWLGCWFYKNGKLIPDRKINGEGE